MRPAQIALLNKLKTEGKVEGDVIKADTFLNHQVDTRLLKMMARDVADKFRPAQLTKILTAETSGIMLAQAVAMELDLPFIYAKKKKPITMATSYMAESFSFTKQETTALHVSREVLGENDRILFIDDFFAKGSTVMAIIDIVEQSGCTLVGAAVIINKSDRKDIYSILTMDEIKQEIPEK